MPHNLTRDGVHCSACDSALRHCRARERPLTSARTEAERWFDLLPLCVRHSDRSVVVDEGRNVGLQELWDRKWDEDNGLRSRDKESRRQERSRERMHERSGERRDEKSKETNYGKSGEKKNDRASSKDNSDTSSDDEDVEDRYCRACELALARCRIWNVPFSTARLDSQKYFAALPVCTAHLSRKDVVKDDKVISLAKLWRDMKAKQPCGACDKAKKLARPLREPYEDATMEGRKYFSPIPFCLLHQKRENIAVEDELMSVKKYWKRMKKMEVCLLCEGAKKWCRPLYGPNDRAVTEGERWFIPSPLCSGHKDRRKILESGEMVGIEEYWKARVEIEGKEKREASRSRESCRGESPSSEESGRLTDSERWSRRHPEMAAGLLSANDAHLHSQHPRGRARSKVDPSREMNYAELESRRRPRSFDSSRAHEVRRHSRSLSPYPPGWTEEQKLRYVEGFRALAPRLERGESENG